jgi:hypothetical protein
MSTELMQIGNLELQIVEGPEYEVPVVDGYQARQKTDNRYVVVKRVCEALGISHQMQTLKLKTKSWAGGMECILPSAGGNQKTFCLALASVPMWLSGIDVGRVKPEARPAIEKIQQWAHDVLYCVASGQIVVSREETLEAICLRIARDAAIAMPLLQEKIKDQEIEIATQKELIGMQDAAIEAMRPQAEVGEAYAKKTGERCITDVAKSILIPNGYCETCPSAFRLLNEMRWIFRREPRTSWRAYADKIRSGCLVDRDVGVFNRETRYQVFFTPIGEVELLRQLGLKRNVRRHSVCVC